jgi:RNA polymerase sigma-70 factor (ECF subfamily)
MTGRSTSAEAVHLDGGDLHDPGPAGLDGRVTLEDTPPARDPIVSFKEVYDEHFRFVWRSLRRLGVPESDVADAVQDVFLVVHRRLCEFEGRSKVTTWLYGICYRVARDRRRLAHVRRRSDDDGEIDQRPDERADVAAAAERRQGLELLDNILDEMPIEQRAVFTLFELDALGGDAIAEVLEIPLGTVYSRLRIAREQFRRSLSRMQARDRFRAAGGER